MSQSPGPDHLSLLDALKNLDSEEAASILAAWRESVPTLSDRDDERDTEGGFRNCRLSTNSSK